jgi:hypothetical protein
MYRGASYMSLEHRLRTLREKTARIEVLKLEIEGLQEEIRLSTGIEETDEETIEGMTLRRALDSIGRGNNASKTEKVALNYKAEQNRLSKSLDISELYEQIRAKQGELKRLEDETLPIIKALQGITDKQRLVVTEFYIKGNTWYTVGIKHQQAFGNYIGRDTCRKIRDEALRKMRRILGE